MELIQEKNSRSGLIGTIVFHVILLLLFIFFGMTYQDPKPINESAMLIDFGNAGGGSSSSQTAATESSSDNEPSTNNLEATENVTATAPENVQTQNTTEAVEMNASSSNNSTAETTEPDDLHPIDFSDHIATTAGQIQYLLSQSCTGKSMDIVRLSEQGNGIQTWSRLVCEYQPQVAGRRMNQWD